MQSTQIQAVSKVSINMELRLHINTPESFSPQVFGLLGYYAALIGSLLQTFRDDLSVPSSRIKQFKKK